MSESDENQDERGRELEAFRLAVFEHDFVAPLNHRLSSYSAALMRLFMAEVSGWIRLGASVGHFPDETREERLIADLVSPGPSQYSFSREEFEQAGEWAAERLAEQNLRIDSRVSVERVADESADADPHLAGFQGSLVAAWEELTPERLWYLELTNVSPTSFFIQFTTELEAAIDGLLGDPSNLLLADRLDGLMTLIERPIPAERGSGTPEPILWRSGTSPAAGLAYNDWVTRKATGEQTHEAAQDFEPLTIEQREARIDELLDGRDYELTEAIVRIAGERP